MSLASELIKARTDRGFSQAHLAEASGISRSAIKAYEAGRNMPGSRELKALCSVLHVTPNQLLFGTEAPTFGESGPTVADALLKADPEWKMLARTRLSALADLLTADECAALLQLSQGIATARHGAEKVRQAFLSADFMAGYTRIVLESAKAGERPNPDSLAKELDAFLERQGHPKIES